MKTNTNLVDVVSGNTQQSSKFSIQASGKMFHALISGLYSDKAGSITREIWSNAWDAHKIVGKQNVPFEVSFPNSLSPLFTCRDFGPGIAHEDMLGFYTVLGHSTKDQDNDAVGKWGVGRVSPLSYTDTFTVVSTHNGLKAHYVVQIGPDGSPACTRMSTITQTDEPSGLEVSFPVRNGDFGSFQQAAKRVALGFDVTPVVRGQSVDLPSLSTQYEGDGYKFYQSDVVRGPLAKMGCVLYPVDRQYLPGPLSLKDILLDFDIGDLEVTVSREQLSYGANEPTEKSIRDKAAAILNQWEKDRQDKIDSCKTQYEATYLNCTSPFFSKKEFTYRGKLLEYQYEAEMYGLIASYNYGIPYFKGHTSLNFTPMQNYTIYVEDTYSKSRDVRARKRIISRAGAHSRWIWVRYNFSKENENLKKFLAQFGGLIPVVYVKDIPDPGATTRTTNRVVKVKSLDRLGSWSDVDLDDATFSKGGVYLKISNNSYEIFGSQDVASVFGAFGETVYVVPKTRWKKFEDASNWVEGVQYFKETFWPKHSAAIKANAERSVSMHYPLGNTSNKITKYRLDKSDSQKIKEVYKILDEAENTLYCGLKPPECYSLYRLFDSVEANQLDLTEVIDMYPFLRYTYSEEEAVRYINAMINTYPETCK